jgi:hypothetical protein
MLLRWLIAAAMSTMILNCNATTQSGFVQQTEMRDLSGYDRAGPYTIELRLETQARNRLEAEIREFLWSHWHQRRLGHVTVTQYSKEGERSTSSYFIEPDEKGAWHIAVKIDRTLVERGGSKSQRSESLEYKAYVVERVDVPKDGLTQGVAIPEGEMRQPQSYRLALKDEKGKSLTKI